MVRRMAATPAYALIFSAITLSACWSSRTVVCGAVSATVPASFRVSAGDGDSVMMIADEAIGMYRPTIHVHRRERPTSDGDLRREHERLSAELVKLGHKVGKLEEAIVDGRRGWSYTQQYTESVARMFESTAKDDSTRVVEHHKMELQLSTQDDTYVVSFVCPVALLEKYRPIFNGFLRSMRFAERKP